MMNKRMILIGVFLASVVTAGASASVVDDKMVDSYRKTLGELVQADTSNPPGNESRAVKVLAARLREAGQDYEIIDFAPGRQNLIARLKGDGSKKPLLLLAHIDVVGTKDQKWTSDPHVLTERDGHLYGRGTEDDLGMAVANLEIFLALKRSVAKFNRDIILAFTGDEESGGLGIRYVLKTKPELLDAEIALNEGGSIVFGTDGKVRYAKIEVAQKTYQDFELVATGTTGHSSVPRADNAIYRLAEALARLEKNPPKPRLLPLTRAFFKERSRLDPAPLGPALKRIAESKGEIPASALKAIASEPMLQANLMTTCVPTMLSGGTKANALPPEARAVLNCRILPDETIEQTEARLVKVIADARVEVKRGEDNGLSGGSSPVDGEAPDAIRKAITETWPGTPVIPVMALGATDSRFLRVRSVKCYGIHPIPRTEADSGRAHGIDERIPIAGIKNGLEFYERLVLALAGGG